MASPDVTTDPGRSPASPAAASAWPSRDASPGDKALTSAVYRAIVRWGGWLVTGYYRFELRGHAFPDDAPVLLVQNHTNGLCDAYFLLSANRRPIRILVKYKLLTTPLIGWMLRRMDAVPMYRKKDGVDTRQNAQSFEAIDRALAERAVIALFPEGESLDAIRLRELRPGVGRMAISAEESAGGGLGLRIVPLGVTYEDRDRFRSGASGVLGEPLDVAAIMAGVDRTEPRAVLNAVMEATTRALSELVFNAEDEAEYFAAISLARIAPTGDAPLGLRRRAAHEALRRDMERDPGGAAERRAILVELGEALRAGRLTGDDVLAPAPGAARTFGAFALLLPVLLVGAVVWAVPMLLAVLVSRLRRTPDKLVTLRAIFGCVFALAWSAALVALAGSSFGAVGALAATALCAVYLATLPRLADALIEAKRAFLRRALEARGNDIQALRANIRSIRGAFELDR